MKPLKDCKYSAFISYAHADDVAWFDWVSHFRYELDRGLSALLRGLRMPPSHLSSENGPIGGVLSEKLRQAVDDSFAMIIVVHDNYAQSEWCLRELEYFKNLFGEQGLRERLYVVALSESAMLGVSGGTAWKQLLPGGEQVWIPFFDPADRNRPIDIYMGPGLVAPAFREPFVRLRGDLADKLRLTASSTAPGAARSDPLVQLLSSASPSGVQLALASGTATTTATAPAGSASAPRVLFGFVTPLCEAAARAALGTLSAAGQPASMLLQDAVFNDFADFDTADQLVLAFDRSPLLMGAIAPGGHLQLQHDAWLRRGRPADHLHWLDLSPEPAATDPALAASLAASLAVTTDSAAPSGSAAYVAGLSVPVMDVRALVQHLHALRATQAPAAPAAAAPGVRIYIESNHHEPNLWEPLGDQLRVKWEALSRELSPEGVAPLRLRTRGLPLEKIDEFPNLDDADGVILLWGRKTSDALVAQINKVENKLAPGRDAPPGIVAYLMPPQQATEPIPAWGWKVLRFDATDAESIDVLEAERDELKRFLRQVHERRKRRDAGDLP